MDDLNLPGSATRARPGTVVTVDFGDGPHRLLLVSQGGGNGTLSLNSPVGKTVCGMVAGQASLVTLPNGENLAVTLLAVEHR